MNDLFYVIIFYFKLSLLLYLIGFLRIAFWDVEAVTFYLLEKVLDLQDNNSWMALNFYPLMTQLSKITGNDKLFITLSNYEWQGSC